MGAFFRSYLYYNWREWRLYHHGDTFKKFESDRQVAFLLGLSDTVVDLLSSSSAYKDIKNAMKVCWGWLENGEYSGN